MATVQLAALAARQVHEARVWWLANRDKARLDVGAGAGWASLGLRGAIE